MIRHLLVVHFCTLSTRQYLLKFSFKLQISCWPSFGVFFIVWLLSVIIFDVIEDDDGPLWTETCSTSSPIPTETDAVQDVSHWQGLATALLAPCIQSPPWSQSLQRTSTVQPAAVTTLWNGWLRYHGSISDTGTQTAYDGYLMSLP
jgi:hypothetical protein